MQKFINLVQAFPRLVDDFAEIVLEKLAQLQSKLYIIQNGLSKKKIHFSYPKANNGIWFGDIDNFHRHLKSISLAEHKPFAEWNGNVYALIFADNNSENSGLRFILTPARISELES